MKSNAGMLKVTYLQKLSQPNITLVQYSRTGKATTQQKLHTLKHNSSTHYYLVTSYIYSKTYSQHSLILSQIAFTEGSPTFMIRITLTCFLQALSVSEGQNQSTVCPPVAESPPRKFGPFFFGRHSGPNWSDFWQHLLLQQYNILQRKSSLIYCQ